MKSEIKNVWMSETCARRGESCGTRCGDCTGKSEKKETVYLCKCVCHRHNRQVYVKPKGFLRNLIGAAFRP